MKRPVIEQHTHREFNIYILDNGEIFSSEHYEVDMGDPIYTVFAVIYPGVVNSRDILYGSGANRQEASKDALREATRLIDQHIS